MMQTLRALPQEAQPPQRMSRVDYDALRYLMWRSDGTDAQKKKALKKFEHAYQKGRCYLPASETQQQRWWRCEARFLYGDYSSWAGWQYRSKHAESIWFVNPFKCPVWKFDRVDRLAVVGEQGIGDEIFFASILPDVMERVGSVVFETDTRLASVMQRSLGVETVPTRLEPTPGEDDEAAYQRVKQEPQADAWVSLADLGRLLRHKDADFPRTAYLKATPERVAEFGNLSGRVGISWRGRQGERKEMLKEFPGAVSLQYDQSWDEDIERPDCDLKDDIEGVMGVLANLEKLVTVSTSVAHLASAMGVPTEVRLARYGTGRMSQLIPWKWVNRRHPGQTLWYPKSTKVIEAEDMRWV